MHAGSEDRRGERQAVSSMDRRITRSWPTRSRIISITVLFAAVSAAAFGYVRYGMDRTLTVGTERLVISPVMPSAFQDYIPVTGNVQPRQTVYLDAVDGGQVVEIFVDEGSMVSQDQPLLRLNNTNLQLQVLNSEAQVAEQLNRLSSTKLQFEQARLSHLRDLVDVEYQIQQSTERLQRIEALMSTGAITRADRKDTELELVRMRRMQEGIKEATRVDRQLQLEQMEQLDQAVKGLNKNLVLARQNLDNLIIKAPITGQLTSLDAHLGESKSPGQRLGQVDEIDGFKVEALVDEHYLSRVAPDQSATVQVDRSEHRLKLVKVYSEVRERQFKIDLEFADQTPESVRRGQTLQLRLQLGASRKSLVLKNGPFYEDTGGVWAFVLSKDGTSAQRRTIRLGRRNPESVEVLEGLAAGDRVITSSYESLQEFDRLVLSGS